MILSKKIKMLLCATSIALTSCVAQIKNAKTETVKVYGNCSMCEKTIESAGNIKKVAAVDWNKDTKMASLTYDGTKTTQDEILKRIALAGYDSDKFLAPADVYNKLEKCCQYERVNRTAVHNMPVANVHAGHNTETVTETKQETNQLKPIFDNYFELKDALIKSEGNQAAESARAMLSNINAVKMNQLSEEEHIVWMKVMKSLGSDATQIEGTKSIENQRQYFTFLSTKMYALIKVSKPEAPIYYQNCPMFNDGKGANWLSKENTIKNPYYGSQMLTCGKTIETIK